MGWLSKFFDAIGSDSSKWDVSSSSYGRDTQLSHKDYDVTIHSRPSESTGHSIDAEVSGERTNHADQN